MCVAPNLVVLIIARDIETKLPREPFMQTCLHLRFRTAYNFPVDFSWNEVYRGQYMPEMSSNKLARSVERDGRTDFQNLEEHLRGVAALCSDETARFGCRRIGELLGLWHDLGKYSDEFQSYLKASSDPEATTEGLRGKVNHSSAGAIHAAQALPTIGRLLAYVIAGHHRGLPDWNTEEHPAASLSARLKERQHLEIALSGNPPDFILATDEALSERPPSRKSEHCFLWVKMLFSALVDADCLNSESFGAPDRSIARDALRTVALESLKQTLQEHLLKLQEQAPKTSVNQIRAEILKACDEAAEKEPGIFSLTVPTGGGKTLSAMSFALRHAVRYQKRRIVYVIPYTSIIEQTAETLRSIFGDVVLEHHSSLDPDDCSVAARLASENWDAPVIVTTSVQFYESLFSNRTSRSRKVHNIVDSVVIIDEVHLLPVHVLDPIKRIMNDLALNYGVSFVLSSATQPALQALKTMEGQTEGLDNIQEIVPDPVALHHRLRRVTVEIPPSLQESTTWEALSKELSALEQVLCVVNSRRDCRELYRLMPAETFHLSALMCAEHRSQVIACIKSRLKERATVRIISTQLIEAGVDIDLPVVYRALAGLDSIAQAGGRCNREGLLTTGVVHIFVPPSRIPQGILGRAASKSRELLSIDSSDVLHPKTFEQFFTLFYSGEGSRMDRNGVLFDISDPRALNFERASENFRIIDDDAQATVIVRFGNEDLLSRLKSEGPSLWLLRKLQRFTVSLYKHEVNHLLARGDLEEITEGLYVQANSALYDPIIGFVADGTGETILSSSQLIG